MKSRVLTVSLLALGVATISLAQTKISGEAKCAKPDPFHMVDVGDKAGHALTLSKNACTWTKPIDIGGLQTKEGQSTAMAEVIGNKSLENGWEFDNMSNGDKIFVKYRGSSTLKDGAPLSFAGTWSFTGGTGKLKGLKGKGTYAGGAPAADGSITFAIEGEYELPT